LSHRRRASSKPGRLDGCRTNSEHCHMDQRDCLAFYPFVVVRIACRVCSRSGAYRLARLAAKHGPETSPLRCAGQIFIRLVCGGPRRAATAGQVAGRCSALREGRRGQGPVGRHDPRVVLGPSRSTAAQSNRGPFPCSLSYPPPRALCLRLHPRSCPRHAFAL
jgi:hypothetical protein